MPYCSKCGVEVDNYVKFCPLCEAPIQNLDDHPESDKKFHLESPLVIKSPLTRRQKRDLSFFIITLLVFIPIGIILAIRFLYKKDFTWEGFILVPLGAFWIYISLFLFFLKKRIVIFGGLILNTLALLLSIDLLDGPPGWFIPLAMPITLLLYIILVILIVIVEQLKRKGVNILGFILLGIGLFCMGVDMTVNFYITGLIFPKWSVIVMVAVSPVALLLLYIHYFLKSDIDLKKKFYM